MDMTRAQARETGGAIQQAMQDHLDAIKELKEYREVIYTKYTLKAPRITGMPRSGSIGKHGLEDGVMELTSIDRKIERHKQAIADVIQVLEDNRSVIKCADEYIELLTMRYVQGLQWPEIQIAIYGDAGNTSKRRMFRKLNAAFKSVWNFWGKRTPDELRETSRGKTRCSTTAEQREKHILQGGK